MQTNAVYAAIVATLLLNHTALAEPMPGWQLAVHGTVARWDGSQGAAAPVDKTFDLTLVLASADGQAMHWLWQLEESGGGGWPWWERFGSWTVAAEGPVDSSQGPALLFERSDANSVIPLMAPQIYLPNALASEANWNVGEQTFVVQKKEQRGDRELWRVTVSSGIGRAKTLWIDEQDALIRAAEQRVFMGQGEEYQLRWEIVAQNQLASEPLAEVVAAHAELANLRAALNVPPRSSEKTLTAAQRQALAQALPASQAAVRWPAMAGLLRHAERDLTLQVEQAQTVEQLVARYQGQPFGPFQLAGSGGETLREQDLAGQVTLLHFWEYRDEPLREPYGQVGYLDFLYGKRLGDGLRVFGVAVDSRLADPRQRPAVLQSVRKLRSFMNLSYPVLWDDGTVLKQCGDPRQAGAGLPLFVLIGRDGRIAHYHVGHYPVDQQQGLKDLNGEVTRVLEAAP